MSRHTAHASSFPHSAERAAGTPSAPSSLPPSNTVLSLSKHALSD
jgi:hypothetical protein